MGSRKSFLKLIAWSMVFAGMCSVSLGVHAENDEESTELSELPFVQESSSDEEESEFSQEEEEEYSETDESELSDDEEEESFQEDEEESSDEESDYYEFEESSYYYDHEPTYYYDESESTPESSFEPIIYYYGTSSYDEESETTEYYEESSEPSTYRETSIDNSELTSRDWEYLKKRLEAETSNKSSDNAIRDIKEGESSQNDSINYLMWGLVLIGMGLVIIGFIICTTISTKRKFSVNLRKKSKKSGTKIQK